MKQPLADPEKAAYQLPTQMFNTWNSWSMSKSNHLELFLKLWLEKVRVLIRMVSLILFTCTLIEVKIRTSGLNHQKYCDLLKCLSDPRWLRTSPFHEIDQLANCRCTGHRLPKPVRLNKNELQGMQILSVQTQTWTQQKQTGAEWSCSCYCCCVVMFYFTTKTMLK